MRLSIFILLLAATASVQSQGPCPGNSAINGYTSIAAINSAMTTELTAIQGGAAPKPPYVFTICPNSVLTVTQPLTPLLSGAAFVCGSDGSASNKCTFQGGANQVAIQDSKVSGYPLQSVTFKGITFQGSTRSSVAAGAGSATTANFINCGWDGFSGDSAIQLNTTAPKGMTVDITGGSVQNGAATSIFNNDKGTLQIDGLSVSGSSGANGIATADGGATTLQNSNFTSNNLGNVASTSSGSSLTVSKSDIAGSGSNLQNVLYAAGTGTTMNVNGTSIHGITQASGLWSGVTYAQGATGTVKDSQLSNNNGMQFGINAKDGSQVTVQGSSLDGNSAAGGTVTAVANALNNSNLVLQDTNITNNSGFTALSFTGFQSFTDFQNTTFDGGNALLAAFIDQNSKFGIKNILFNNVQTSACPPPNQREFIENTGSKCFYRGPGACTGICGVLQNKTLAPSVRATSAPSAKATVAPSAAPTSTPTQAPVAPSTAPVVPTLTPSAATVAPSKAASAPIQTSSVPTTTPASVGPTKAPIRPTKAPAQPTKAPVAKTTAPIVSAAQSSTPTITVSPTISAFPTFLVPSIPPVPIAADRTPRPTTGAPTTSAPTYVVTRRPVVRRTSRPTKRSRRPKRGKKRPAKNNGAKGKTGAANKGAADNNGPIGKTEAGNKGEGNNNNKGKADGFTSTAPFAGAGTVNPSPTPTMSGTPNFGQGTQKSKKKQPDGGTGSGHGSTRKRQHKNIFADRSTNKQRRF